MSLIMCGADRKNARRVEEYCPECDSVQVQLEQWQNPYMAPDFLCTGCGYTIHEGAKLEFGILLPHQRDKRVEDIEERLERALTDAEYEAMKEAEIAYINAATPWDTEEANR